MKPQISPLRYASVEMTSLFGSAKHRFQDELSSRPKRSEVERSAVSPEVLKNAFCFSKPLSMEPVLEMFFRASPKIWARTFDRERSALVSTSQPQLTKL
jgi:hypothetical protein